MRLHPREVVVQLLEARPVIFHNQLCLDQQLKLVNFSFILIKTTLFVSFP